MIKKYQLRYDREGRRVPPDGVEGLATEEIWTSDAPRGSRKWKRENELLNEFLAGRIDGRDRALREIARDPLVAKRLALRRARPEMSAVDRELDRILEEMEHYAKQVLRGRRLPTTLGAFAYNRVDGKREFRIPHTPVRRGGMTLLEFVRDRRHSPEWYAVDLLVSYWDIRRAIRDGNAKFAAWWMHEATKMMAQARFRAESEPHVINDLKGMRNRSEGGRARKRALDAEWAEIQRAAEAIRKANPTLRKPEVIKILLSDFPSETMRRPAFRTLRKHIKLQRF